MADDSSPVVVAGGGTITATTAGPCGCCRCRCQVSPGGPLTDMPEVLYATVRGRNTCRPLYTVPGSSTYVVGMDLTRFSGVFPLARLDLPPDPTSINNCCYSYLYRYPQTVANCGIDRPFPGAVLTLTCTGRYSFCNGCVGSMTRTGVGGWFFPFACCPIPPDAPPPINYQDITITNLQVSNPFAWRFKVFSCAPFCAAAELFNIGAAGSPCSPYYVNGRFDWDTPGPVPPVDTQYGVPEAGYGCGELLMRIDWTEVPGATCDGGSYGAAGALPPAVAAALPAGTPVLGEFEYVTAARLAADATALATRLPPDIDLVCGVSRSGLVPAGLVAAALHVPLRPVSRATGVVDAGGGFRMGGHPGETTTPTHVLIVDDTAAGGAELRALLPVVRAAYPAARVSRAVVYCHPHALGEVDFYHAVYPGTHYLEWNWPNAGHGQGCCYDFDGILCEECPPGDDDDGPRYRAFLRAARPLFLPRRAAVHTVVTARHRRYEAETRDWLARHGVRVEHLVMRDWEWTPDAPHDPDRIARWKAGHYVRSGLPLMAESEPRQAAAIARDSGKPVLCPAAEKVFPGKPVTTPRPLPLVEQMPCPHRGAKLQAAKSCCDEGGSVWACALFGRVTLTEQAGVVLDNCRDCDHRPTGEG